MDLKLKNIVWVGKNISQKFESICQEVDNIDTVKYVESQVQAVGESVKKFYSDVVQDVVPPLVDPVKHESQEVISKGKASISSYIKSMIGFEGISVDTANKQSREDLNTVDPVKNQEIHAFSQLDHVNLLAAPLLVASDEGAQSDLLSDQADDDDDDSTYKVLDVGLEEHAFKEFSSTSEVLELMSLVEKDSIEASLSCEFGDYNNKHVCEVMAEVSSATSVHVVDCQCTQKSNTVCDDFAAVTVSDDSNTLAASEMAYSNGSTNLSGNTPENFPMDIEFHDNAVDEVGCVSDSSDALTSSKLLLMTTPEGKAAESVLVNSSSVPSLESIGEDEYVSTANCTGSQTEISPSNDVDHCESAQYDVLTMTSSDTGPRHDYCDDMDYSEMETIELFNKVKLDDSSLMVDDSALYAVPYRTQKLRSFKKRIQDAFTSRKRLTKEYEQLAIWFGDAYMGSSQDTVQSHKLLTTSSTKDTNNLNSDQACDSDWELL